MSDRRNFWKLRLLLAALMVLFLGGKALYGQSQAITATISGVILDASGLPVSGAKLALTSPDRAISRTAETEGDGLYTFTLLPSAVYTLEVEAPGFKRYKQEGITLGPGQTAQQNISLVVGVMTESIEITSQAPLMNADNANISSDISGRQVAELPLNLRNVIGLAVLNSSVSNAAELQVVGAPGLSGRRIVPQFWRHILQHRRIFVRWGLGYAARLGRCDLCSIGRLCRTVQDSDQRLYGAVWV
jgi:hypothetical protein